MRKLHLLVFAVLVAALGAGGYGLYRLGLQRGMATGVAPATTTTAQNEPGEDATRRHMAAGLKAGDVDPSNGRKILYYHDPMVPANRFDTPGKSPFMDMMMSPVYAGGDADPGGVSIGSRMQQNLGLRTAEVAQGVMSPQIGAVGSIAFNEREQAVVQARATGFVEQLNVRATLDSVAKGQTLAQLYVPEWIAAQEEFLSLQRARGADLGPLMDAARQRMRQAGMTDAQIGLVERSGRTQPRIALVAPISGVLTDIAVREGMTVTPGATLFRINGLSTVWANAEVPESQAALVRPGARVQAEAPAFPGKHFEGRVQALLPEVNPATRTIKARLELSNPGGRLVPGMFVSMRFADASPEKALLIPTEAVIRTGRRTVAIVAEEGGRFRPVDVEIGTESGDQTVVRRGLALGQRVVASSQFLIDSEASLRGVEARLNAGAEPTPTPAVPASANAPRHAGTAKLESITREAVSLSHGPIPSIRWGAMTMEFKLPASGAPAGVKVGDRVRFEFFIDKDDMPQLTSITPAEPGRER